MMIKCQMWLQATRLRTLSLSIASIFMGSSVAINRDSFEWSVFILIILTATALQILSNFANDYGDSQQGVDNDTRQGPSRAVQTGAISKEAMLYAIIIMILICLALGIFLLLLAFSVDQVGYLLAWFLVGLVAIGAAIGYTVGKRPFGYHRLGDLVVFIFFGLVAVNGTHFLMTQAFEWQVLLIAIPSGLFCVGVLNINNIRDLENDKKSGKYTVAGLLNHFGASVYQAVIISLAILILLAYVILNDASGVAYSFCITIPLFIYNIKSVFRYREQPKKLDPYLKQMAVSYLLLSVIWFNSIWLAS